MPGSIVISLRKSTGSGYVRLIRGQLSPGRLGRAREVAARLSTARDWCHQRCNQRPAPRRYRVHSGGTWPPLSPCIQGRERIVGTAIRAGGFEVGGVHRRSKRLHRCNYLSDQRCEFTTAAPTVEECAASSACYKQGSKRWERAARRNDGDVPRAPGVRLTRHTIRIADAEAEPSAPVERYRIMAPLVWSYSPSRSRRCARTRSRA